MRARLLEERRQRRQAKLLEVARGRLVDRDVLDFFKRQGKGYQTRMNAVLRAYMEAVEKKG